MNWDFLFDLPWWAQVIIVVIAVGIAVTQTQQEDVTAPGRALAKKFGALGNLQGRTKQEIVASVGRPTSFSALTGNQTLLQWQATGFHIALIFDGEICGGVTHEYCAQ
jgi:hypothetical protein